MLNMRKTVVTPIVLKSVSLGIFNKQQAVAYRAENSNQKIAETLAAEAPELHHPHRRGRREEHGEAHRHAGGQRRRAERLAQLG